MFKNSDRNKESKDTVLSLYKIMLPVAEWFTVKHVVNIADINKSYYDWYTLA